MSRPLDYDWIVVGSGFGGSVAALRLAEKGYKVGVLECGRRFEDDEFADSTWNCKRYLWAPKLGCRGVLRLTLFSDIAILSGGGVGGGSLGYANTLYRAPQPFFRDTQWRDLGDWEERPRAPLRDGGADVGRDARALRRRRRPRAARPRARPRRGAHAFEDERGRLLRRARRDRGGSVLRRRGPESLGLREVRAVHGRLPLQREEHAGEELPPPRREPRRARDARPDGLRREPARRCGGRLGGLRRQLPPRRELVPPRQAHAHRARRRVRRGRARHQPAAAHVQGPRLAAAPLRARRPSRAHQQRGDPRRDRRRQVGRLHRAGGDHGLDLPATRTPTSRR